MKIKKKLKVFKALHEDSNTGWVWLPSIDAKIRSRDYIRIKFEHSSILCVVRIIDNDFLVHYNEGHTTKIIDSTSALIISEYYRDKLGDLKTGKEYDIEIKKVWTYDFISKTRALLQHPDNINKVAGWLALISISISALGVILSLLSH